ncbi:MAG: adenosine deaminase [Deltaproteobacteria bacterium]|nr:adenosine deaminase [Nannocystaceae bacterium]
MSGAPPSAARTRTLPKVELHLHIEGALEPELMFALAQRNRVALPWRDVAAAQGAYAFADLQAFLDVYYQAAKVLLHAQDFYELTATYCARAAADGVRHAEIFVDPQTHTVRGVALDAVVEGMTSALSEARERYGMTSAIIPCFLRHLPPEAAAACFSDCLRFGDRFTAFGLDSGERDRPPRMFAGVFGRVRAAGFKAVAHAGEEGPPAYIEEALDFLEVARIDHGVRCMESPQLVERLVRERVPLTVCPLSNVRLRVFDRLADHPLPAMLAAGLRVSLNSDDPAYLGGYIGENFIACAEAFDLDELALQRLARNAIDAAFVDEARRAVLHAELEAWARPCA